METFGAPFNIALTHPLDSQTLFTCTCCGAAPQPAKDDVDVS